MKWLFLLLALGSLDARPRVALVLGGGGARGIAHVGVLEVLEEAEIPIDLIVGCSAGGIVGALYADCKNAKQMENQFSGLKRSTLIEVNFLRGRFGLSGGQALRRFLRKNIAATELQDLQIPLIVVATDLHTGELIEYSTGPICSTIAASAAYPFVFQPVKYEGRTLVDGGILEPVPVSVARHYQPDLLIAVDVGMPLAADPPSNLFGVLQRSIEITYMKQSGQCVQDADIVIYPELEDMGVFEDGRNEFACTRGREAAQKMLPQILDALERIP